MSKLFSPDQEWRSRSPVPVYDGEPELNGLYWKAWELAHDHLIDLPGMPQTPYMDVHRANIARIIIPPNKIQKILPAVDFVRVVDKKL